MLYVRLIVPPQNKSLFPRPMQHIVPAAIFLILLKKKYCVKVPEYDVFDVTIDNPLDVRAGYGAGERPAAVRDVQQGGRLLHQSGKGAALSGKPQLGT